MSHRYPVTQFLIAVNLLAFLWEIAATGGGILAISPSDAALSTVLQAGALAPIEVTQYHEYWRIITSAFLHEGILHIAVNMYSLYVLGRFLEPILGSWRMALIYMVSLLVSGFSVIYFSFGSPDVSTLGASGAIFGIFGALFAIGLKFGKHGMDLVRANLPILIVNLIFTFAVPMISKAAHVGGLIAGFILTYAIYFPPRRVQPEVFDSSGSALETEYQSPRDDATHER